MKQIHLVVVYDMENGALSVDWETTITRFRGEVVYKSAEGWVELNKLEEAVLDELIPQLDNHLGFFHLDL